MSADTSAHSPSLDGGCLRSASDPGSARPEIYTIGHSNVPLAEFLARLDRHAIDVVADVRSRPFARYATHFDAAPLKAAIEAAGRRYLFLGRELGGRPEGGAFYDAEGHVRYDRVAATPFFRAGIDRLERGITRYRVALMCSEGDPAACHRHLLIGRVLADRGIVVRHVGPDGEILREPDRAEAGATAGQMTLFDDREVTPWRSIRSVSPRNRPPSSSRP